MYHCGSTVHWVVVRGLARTTVGAQVLTLGGGGHVGIAVGQPHRLANPTTEPMEVVVELQFGDYVGEDDTVRLDDDCGRV